MGPVLIFDKSTLQGLNVDESVLLDHLFLTNITPLFFVETLADLEKEVRKGRTPEDVVGNIAHKTPDLASRANAHHLTILQGELLGLQRFRVDDWRPVISHGRAVELEGGTGIVFQNTPEEEAISRWQRGEFLDVERTTARIWRKSLSNIDHNAIAQHLKPLLAGPRPVDFSELKNAVMAIVDQANVERSLVLGMDLVGISTAYQEKVLARWRAAGAPSLSDFAPYFRHVLLLDLFFYLGIATNHISGSRPSHKIDLAYLYYLPFCMIFASNDKLHKQVVPSFLRPDQSFVDGAELKADLARLNAQLLALPASEKSRGLFHLAKYPSEDTSFLITRLWDKHIPRWRGQMQSEVSGTSRRPTGTNPEILSNIKKLSEAAERSTSVITSPTHGGEPDSLLIKRLVRARKGSWRRFPSEVERPGKK